MYLKLEVEHAIGKVEWDFEPRAGDKGCKSSAKGEVIPGVSFEGTRLVDYPKIAATCKFALALSTRPGGGAMPSSAPSRFHGPDLERRV